MSHEAPIPEDTLARLLAGKATEGDQMLAYNALAAALQNSQSEPMDSQGEVAKACDCRSDIEAKLTERFKEQFPAATGHEVKLLGYGFGIGGDNRVFTAGYMPYETVANVPLKKGGVKRAKSKGSMVFSFCPYCGAKQG